MVLGILLAVNACSSAPNDISSIDEALKLKIIGQWAQGESPYGIASFEKDGRYEGWIYDNAKKGKLLYEMKGKWWIKDKKLYNSLSEMKPTLPGMDMQKVEVDKIVDITSDTMTLINDKSTEYTKKRVNSSN
jgi:hypothetical protein